MADSSWPSRNAPAFPKGGASPLSLRALRACEPFLAVAGIGAWMYEAGGRLWWSEQTRQIHGVAEDFLPDRDAAISFYAPEARAEISAAFEAAILDALPWDMELPIIRADGQRRQVRSRGRRAETAGQAPVTVMGTFEDVTARHEAAARAARELALRARTETLLRDVISGIPAALSVYDGDERLILVNDSYRGLLPGNETLMIKGEKLADIITRKVMANHYVPEISADDTPAARRAWVADYLKRHRSQGYRRIFHLKDDKWMQASTAMSTSGNIVSIRTDITPLMRAERELRRRAGEDALTGLANREVLMAALARLSEQRPGAHAGGVSGGIVVLLDVDFFKAVNDGLGHAAGDLLLRLTGRRLRRCLREGDVAARLSGDEFALIVHGPRSPAQIGGFLARLMKMLRRAMRLGTNRYAPSVSIGVTAFPAPGASPKILLANADAALYEAKRQGRARAIVFDDSLAARVERRTRLADQLRRAIAERRLVAALQPQQRLSDGGVMGFEALARWQEDGDWIAPAEFVAIAEETGLAQALGVQVMDNAMAGFAAMITAGLDPGQLAVNVSTAQLLADDFLETVKRLLARHGLPPQRLEVEVTETVLLDRSIARINQTLEALRGLGVSLAMDDFGTGYASLSHLTSFPVDRIKIDQSFTRAVAQDGNGGLIARTLIGLGQGLGLEVIAEGVETEAQRRFLVSHGCTAIQGYLFARPMLADEARQWLAARPVPAAAA